MKRIVILVAIVCSVVFGQEFADQGTFEAGGRISFTSVDYNNGTDYRENTFTVMPVFNWFFADQIYLATKVNMEFTNNGSFLGIGAGAGYAFIPDAAVIPYVDAGIQFLYSGYVEKAGLGIPVNAGVKIPLFRHVALDVGGYVYTKFINDNPGADFGFNGGVTVLIF